MLMPKRTKYRKSHRLTYDGHAKGNTTLSNGEFGLMAMEGAWVSARQIEAARIAMTRYMRRGGKVFINIFPHLPITKKPLETRQGKGKGNPEGFVAPVTPGRMLFEVGGVPFEIAKEALRLGAQKLPITTKFVVSNSYDFENENA